MKSPVKVWRDTKNLKDNLGKVGKVLTFTKIFVAPQDFEHQIPYVVGIIQFKDKKRKSLEVVDYDEKTLKIGTRIVTVIRRIGQAKPEEVIEYGIKAKPI